jgi:hypothetical protein
MDTGKRIRVVLVSPGDVAKERAAAERVINELNHGVAEHRLVLWRWESDARPGLHPQGAQGLIEHLMDIQSADLVIGVFWKRFGTPTRHAASGTEQELRRAWASWRQHGRPEVMLYFSSQAYAPKTSEDLSQWQRVMAFKDDLPSEMLWWAYGRPREFERVLREHLSRYLLAHNASVGPRVVGPVSQPTPAATVLDALEPEDGRPEPQDSGEARQEALQRFQNETPKRERIARERVESRRVRNEYEKQQQRLANARAQCREWDERAARQEAAEEVRRARIIARDTESARERNAFLERASAEREERARATAREWSQDPTDTPRAVVPGPNERRTVADGIARRVLVAILACVPIAVLAFAVWLAFANQPLGSILWVLAFCIGSWLLFRDPTDED